MCTAYSNSEYPIPLTGILSTINTILAEASTDRNRAFGMSLLPTGWALGLVMGSAISGFLADPIGQYNLTIDSKWSESRPVKYY